MLKNYLKIAFRNLWRHKAFSFITILGLTVGMTACLFIYLYVRFERSYDTFHSKADRIYRLVTDVKTPSEVIHAGITNWPYAPNLKADFPEVEAFVRTSHTGMVMRKDDRKFQEDRVLFADSSLFRVFDFKLLEGDPATALKTPFSVVLSQTAARKYFGPASPIGQTLMLDGDADVGTVTGVMQDLPENSQVRGDVLLSMTTLTQRYRPDIDQQWTNFDATTYLLLKPGASAAALQKKFPGFLERHTGKEMRQNQMFFTLFLEPLKDVYLRSTRESEQKGSLANVYIFSIIAAFILLLACINFINLATARSAERAREVGIRKVAGAERPQLTAQFIGESVIQALLAFVLALALSSLLLPLFNQLAGKTISSGILHDRATVLLLLGMALGIGGLAGLYPALVLSGYRPIVVLKGRFASGGKGVALRKALVIAQFTISIALVIGTLVVYRQVSYMRSQGLGFQKDQVLVLDTQGDAAREALQTGLASVPGVQSIALSSAVPGSPNSKAYSEIENKKGDMQVANMDLYFVDFNYIPQFGIPVVAGRAFSKDFATDTTQAMVINEEAVKLLGYASPAEAIGRRFSQWGREGTIIGVVKNFHFRALQQAIQPLSMRIEPTRSNLLSVKVSAARLPATIAAVEKEWKTIITKRPFSFYFLDEYFDRQYRDEQRFGKLFFSFALLAIFISCLGLLGLASYSTLQRTKEIGIRKVLGANTTSIVQLLTKSFLQLVYISFAAAVPLAWYFMHQWLQDFAYRIQLSWWIFLAAGLLAVGIAFVTVSFLAVRAALANPVKSLRSE